MHNKFLFLLILFSYIYPLKAQDFLSFSEDAFKVDSILPTYHTSFPIYSLAEENEMPELVYPQYIPLTSAEKKLLKRYKHKLSDNPIQIRTLTTEKKQKHWELVLNPFVYKHNKYLRLVSGKIKHSSLNPIQESTNKKANKLDVPRFNIQARYKSNSVLSQGRWVKIRVKETGIFQLNESFLKQLGFSDLSKVKVFGYGGFPQKETIRYDETEYDDLVEVPLFRRPTSLLFYAKATVGWTDWKYYAEYKTYVSSRLRNAYANYGYYFITEGENPAIFETSPYDSSKSYKEITSFPERVLYEKDEYAWMESGSELFEGYDYRIGNSKTYTLPTPDAVERSTIITQIDLGAVPTSTVYANVNLEQKKIGTLAFYPIKEYYVMSPNKSIFATNQTLNEQTNVNVTFPRNVSAHLDKITLNYTRKLKFKDKSLSFSHYEKEAVNFQISNATAQIQVWQIGNAKKAMKSLPTIFDKGVLTAQAKEGDGQFIAVDITANFPSPEVVGEIQNQNLHAHKDVDMIIIIPQSAKMIGEVERLKKLHETYHKLKVQIVRADEIYNEFSSGTPDVMAYRRYLKMLYDKAPAGKEPKYLLLFGPSIWDNRLLTNATKGLKSEDLLLCYETENSYHKVSSYVTDDFFGLLDDNEGSLRFGKLDIAIGRINPNTLAEAKIVVDKIQAYLENKVVGAWKNKIYILGDDGDNNLHMNDADKIAFVVDSLNNKFQLQKVYWDTFNKESTATGVRYPEITTLLKNAIQESALMMNYTGHGSPTLISHEHVLTIHDFKGNSYNRFPFWAFAACEVTPFDGLTDYISYASLFNPRGGAISVYGACRDVYASHNYKLNYAMTKNLLTKNEKGQPRTIAEAIREAKNAQIGDDLGNKNKYIYLGDPAIYLSTPRYNIYIDSLNNQALEHKTYLLKAGDVVTFKGYIALEDTTKVNTSFNGEVTLSLFDEKEVLTGKKNQPTKSDFATTVRRNTLFEGSNNVKDGRFSITIPIPKNLSYSQNTGKIFCYAVNHNHSEEAHGIWENLILNGSATNVEEDTISPTVDIYLNTPNFKDGEDVGNKPVLYAIVKDSAGINATGLSVGHDLELKIDNNPIYTYKLNDYFSYDFGSYTSGKIKFTLPSLSKGKHTLTFRAWDLNDNSTTKTLSFFVSDLPTNIYNVRLAQNPIQNGVTQIFLKHPYINKDITYNFKLYALSGKLCQSFSYTDKGSTGQFIYNLNLNKYSTFLPTGVYLLKVSFIVEGKEKDHQIQKIILLK